VASATSQGQALLLQGPPRPRQHQAMGHGSLLVLCQKAAPEGQHQPGLPGQAVALPGQHRPIGEIPPTAGAGNALQQGGVGLQPPPLGVMPAQAQAHHPWGSSGTGRLSMARPICQQGLKAA
jgi:hypothetical protein